MLNINHLHKLFLLSIYLNLQCKIFTNKKAIVLYYGIRVHEGYSADILINKKGYKKAIECCAQTMAQYFNL